MTGRSWGHRLHLKAAEKDTVTVTWCWLQLPRLKFLHPVRHPCITTNWTLCWGRAEIHAHILAMSSVTFSTFSLAEPSCEQRPESQQVEALIWMFAPVLAPSAQLFSPRLPLHSHASEAAFLHGAAYLGFAHFSFTGINSSWQSKTENDYLVYLLFSKLQIIIESNLI